VASILVAEDNVLNFELVRDVLVARGHEVQWSRDGMDTLAQARSGAFDLMLLDLHMPKLSGLQVLEQLREKPGRRRPRILVVSADAMGDIASEVIAAGADAYISKPIEVGSLTQEVEKQLRTS
jgi:CheY-like chemotaxis protein